jgi:hypothetical protein
MHFGWGVGLPKEKQHYIFLLLITGLCISDFVFSSKKLQEVLSRSEDIFASKYCTVGHYGCQKSRISDLKVQVRQKSCVFVHPYM